MNFRTLDLNLLRVFDVVMAERHVTRAAERLAMSQPAVSNALRRLREAIGEDLFVPGAAGVTPTRHAEALWPTVRDALDALRTVIDPQPFDPQRDERRFTVAMADATAAVVVPVLMQAWAAAGARAGLHVTGLGSRDPRPLLEHGDADAALGFFPEVDKAVTIQGDAAATRLEHLYECDYVCVMRRGHPLAAKPVLSLDDYCAAQHLRVNFAGRPRGFVDEALLRLGASRRVLLTLEHFSVVGGVLRVSDLLAVLPHSYVPIAGPGEPLVVRAVPFEMPRI
ncbi:MAG TPA: LysR family transcriptional regulator, partial [Gemmatimonadales bacterium]|nr:LysR family transcriptional regulator [Gemmatimonadales bacterium]